MDWPLKTHETIVSCVNSIELHSGMNNFDLKSLRLKIGLDPKHKATLGLKFRLQTVDFKNMRLRIELDLKLNTKEN